MGLILLLPGPDGLGAGEVSGRSFLPVLLVYLPLFMATRALSDSGNIPAAVGMWVPDAVLLVAGTVLLLRAYRR